MSDEPFEPIPADEFTREQLDALILGLRLSDLPEHTFRQARHLLVWNHDRDAWRVRAQRAEAWVSSSEYLGPELAYAVLAAERDHRNGNAVCWGEHSQPCAVCGAAAKLHALERTAEPEPDVFEEVDDVRWV